VSGLLGYFILTEVKVQSTHLHNRRSIILETSLREGPPENQTTKWQLAGEKFLIFDLSILK
jgi:hypothetical protein